uniref:Uncharacterized protein n=1 Tax=Timema poppense TaxID=170557 RepID=A0A7R9DXH0_TIMPO|nr:unnamed protein product [Timema poppensis]
MILTTSIRKVSKLSSTLVIRLALTTITMSSMNCWITTFNL